MNDHPLLRDASRHAEPPPTRLDPARRQALTQAAAHAWWRQRRRQRITRWATVAAAAGLMVGTAMIVLVPVPAPPAVPAEVANRSQMAPAAAPAPAEMMGADKAAPPVVAPGGNGTQKVGSAPSTPSDQLAPLAATAPGVMADDHRADREAQFAVDQMESRARTRPSVAAPTTRILVDHPWPTIRAQLQAGQWPAFAPHVSAAVRRPAAEHTVATPDPRADRLLAILAQLHTAAGRTALQQFIAATETDTDALAAELLELARTAWAIDP